MRVETFLLALMQLTAGIMFCLVAATGGSSLFWISGGIFLAVSLFTLLTRE